MNKKVKKLKIKLKYILIKNTKFMGKMKKKKEKKLKKQNLKDNQYQNQYLKTKFKQYIFFNEFYG